MTLFFRSKSYGPGGRGFNFNAPSTPTYSVSEGEEAEEEEEEEDDDEGVDLEGFNSATTWFVSPRLKEREGFGGRARWRRRRKKAEEQTQLPIVEIVMAALRKSLVTCSVEREDVATSMEIGWPTEVRHVSHVTFDSFNGFLGLPLELQPQLPRRVPSASVRVFGVSPQSMQCSIDGQGNSVPTILLRMQKRLYTEGGLKAEGIFRIAAENSQEEYVRSQLNNGLIPRGIDIHCLAGLIKAWFRELPTGVLDSLTAEQVMHCSTEDQCALLVKLLPPTEGALLDWAINLMADVVHNKRYNKMNARNIAMVFAPNMTQMADPLTALIHAVQVMNLLKMLIEKTLQEREETAPVNQESPYILPSSLDPLNTAGGDVTSHKMPTGECCVEERKGHNLLRAVILDRMEISSMQRQGRSARGRSDDAGKPCESVSGPSSPISLGGTEAVEMKDGGSRVASGGCESGEGEGLLERLSFRKGVKKLCRHPVFQLSKPAKKNGSLGDVNT